MDAMGAEPTDPPWSVVVLMTTIPKRIDHIEPVIDSMLRQTLEAKPIRITRCVDLGPGTHLLNGLRLVSDPWTFMVVVDDDHIYGGGEGRREADLDGAELIEQLMRSALANPGSAVAAQGFLSVPGILESQELTSLQQQGADAAKLWTWGWAW
eukprot:Skav203555  [mRNA]  locus=scaffold3576:90302:92450:+ [translate_table: standard]